MSVLSLENINFGFGDKTILKNVSCKLLTGEHAGLVGANGAGKSTLLNIITGELIPDEGKITCSAGLEHIGYLHQHMDEGEDKKTINEILKSAFEELYTKEEKMISIGNRLSLATNNDEETERLINEMGKLQDEINASDFYSMDSLIDNVAHGLGIHNFGMDTVMGRLSGGQKTKVRLAKLLLRKPDILLLDEPTNYLDKEHVEWLGNYLTNYKNSFIVISHDTVFLNRITNVIFNIEFTILKRYKGDYNTFLKLKEAETKRYIEEYNRQQKQIAKMEDFINKNIVRASTTKRAQSRQKQLNKIDRMEKPKTNPKANFSFLMSRPSGKHILQIRDMSIGYNHPVMNNLNLNLMREDKIAITGCNGIGKSTLLKTIMGVIPALSGKIKFGEYVYPVYFEQETKASDRTAMEEVREEFPDKTNREIREALARCGLRQEHVTEKMSSLSGGEQSKVRLCKLMMKPGNWLLLDEPTNHLDVESKKSLKEAIIAFQGTVIVVCHEKEFYEEWVTDVWDMENRK
ncbi:ABC-F family ATP-binding cassette domain-containing protein [Clostridium oryzae]|uniref:Putative ABC transporter ATP-binding protein YbiT n=1 Tax=Clostridium oryzae TaxID=1450648 RepID=A0A1V4IQ40_9CLOT|nr:ABC-F family ATP-binding cassette domain-containing protein [Clostridium oryzae]OPJ61924.1 putative ABC transporter ATP-binding protein YbiT [Clostridium oryzae]